jgi:hypothetical protein
VCDKQNSIVSLENTTTQHTHTKMKVLFFCVPFHGHYNILLNYRNKHYPFSPFVFLCWQNTDLSLIKHNDNIFIRCPEPLKDSCPIQFNLKRAQSIYPYLKDYILGLGEPVDYVVYDFFCIEVEMLCRSLRIQTVCSIPAVITPEPNLTYLKSQLKLHTDLLVQIESSYKIENLFNQFTLISDSCALLSQEEQWIWQHKSFLGNNLSTWNQHLNSNSKLVFMDNNNDVGEILHDENHDYPDDSKKQENQWEIVYINFGTVVTGNLLIINPDLKYILQKIYLFLIDTIIRYSSYRVVLVTPYITQKIIDTDESWCKFFSSSPISSNSRVQWHSFIDQQMFLKDNSDKIAFFITHGGGNSMIESINNNIPTFVIPWFGDQHVSAKLVDDCDIGDSFPFEYLGVSTQFVTKWIHHCKSQRSLFDHELSVLGERLVRKYLSSNEQLESWRHSISCLKFRIKVKDTIINNPSVVKWKEGDLLFGINSDRHQFALSFKQPELFAIGDMRPFTTIHDLKKTPHRLPRIVDHYNDIITKEETLNQTLNESPQFEFHKQLKLFSDHISQKLKETPPQSSTEPDSKERLWQMCVWAISHFKTSHIHFDVSHFSNSINLATKLELEYMAKNFATLFERVTFYVNLEKISTPLSFIYSRWHNTLNKAFSNSYRQSLTWLHQKLVEWCHNAVDFEVEVQSRVKTKESIDSNFQKRERYILNDIFGIRLITTWTQDVFVLFKKIIENLNEITKNSSIELNHLYRVEFHEKNKVIYLFGNMFGDIPLEIQIWPRILYTGFAYDHDRIYKPTKNDVEMNEEFSKRRYEQQNIVQQVVDDLKWV